MEKAEFPPIRVDVYNGMFTEICNMTPHEKHIIFDVLLRDENLRRRDQHRVNLMKAELQELRRKGALRPSEDGDGVYDSGRSCSRCRAELGWIVNRGAVCQACRLRVCRVCREYTVRTIDWVCTVCYKRTEIQAATGEWMNEFVKKPGQNRFYMSAADIIKSTIRRSWTISDPTPRWPSSRDSPEFRPYNSLPRGQDVSEYPSLTRKSTSNKSPTSPKTTELPNKTQQSALNVNQTTDETDQIPTKEEKEENGTYVRQRRISLFERTLSELYDKDGKRSKRVSSLDKSEDQKKNSIVDDNDNKNKNQDLKPTKIPSPKKKMHTTRSDTAAIVTKKEPIKKFSSLQNSNNKKSNSIEKQLQGEKHVSFEHVEAEVTVNNKPIVFKSGIPRRDSKISTNDNKKTDDDNNKDNINNFKIHDESSVSAEETDNSQSSELYFAQVDTIIEESDNTEVEQLSGTLFRKVAVRKKRQDFKKSQAFDEGRERVRSSGSTSDRRDDLIDLEAGRILLPEGDDYKLVFISSDSSSKEEDADDNDSISSSSVTTAQSFSIDDCDWDYFEPSASIRPVLREWSWSNRNSPFGSPRVYRRGVLDSPIGSPLVCRRARESDTGTDEDVTRPDSGSPVSSDSAGFLSRVRSSSENEDHIPVDVLYSEKSDKKDDNKMEEVATRDKEENKQLQCKHQSSDEPASVTEKCGGVRQVGNNPPSLWSPACRSCGAAGPLQAAQFVPIPVLVPIPVPVPASLWNPLDAPVILYNSDSLDANLRMRLRMLQQRVAGTMLWSGVNPASLISPLISTGDAATLLSVQHSLFNSAGEADMSTTETASMPAASERNSNQQHVTDVHKAETETSDLNPGASVAECVPHNSSAMSDNQQIPNYPDTAKNVSNETLSSEVPSFTNGGYLQCENMYMSSSESSDSNAEQGSRKPRVRRTYNVSGAVMRESDDALPDSDVTSDEEKVRRTSQSSVSNREDEMSSSGSEDTDSDDTGTVADKKPKRFSRVFVVNTNDSSSDVEDNTDSSSDTETSDNDTDTEKDCITLNYMKSLTDASASDDNVNEPVILIKHVKSGESADTPSAKVNDVNVNSEKLKCVESVDDGSIVLLKHTMCRDSRDNSDEDNGMTSEILFCTKTNTLSDSASDASDIDNSFINKLNDTVIFCENIDSDFKLKCNNIKKSVCGDSNDTVESEQRTTNVGSVNKDQIGAHSNVDAIKQANSTPASRNEKNVEFIGDCLQVVTEESKQTKIDLETRVEPDMKVNNAVTKGHSRVSFLQDSEPPPVMFREDTVDSDSSSEASLNDNDECQRLLGDGTSESETYEGDKSTIKQEGKLSEVRTATAFGSEWNDGAVIRSGDPVTDGKERRDEKAIETKQRGARTGAPLSAVDNETRQNHVPARYTSLVMITQEPPLPQVSVVPSDTTTIVPSDSDVIVQHTNWQNVADDSDDNVTNGNESAGLAGYFAIALEKPGIERTTPRKPVLVTKTPSKSADSEAVTVVTTSDTLLLADSDPTVGTDGVTVVTGGDTLSAVVCSEDGLADDDSWVEEISYDEDEFNTTTATDSSSGEEVTLSTTAVVDHEEELRGYHRSAIDFTLHTIVEESCEESEVEQSQPNNKPRPTSTTDLEKYFFYRLGDGTMPNNINNREDAYSETSSIYSEGMDSLGTPDDVTNDNVDPAELASSRLEKYFLSGFMGFTAERRDSDGSVGSDSEGRPSPEQRRKRLVRARGTGRSHSSSLDNLLTNAELSGTEQAKDAELASDNSSSSESDTLDELSNNFEKSDGQFDTVKRKKCKKQRVITGGSSSPLDEKKGLETMEEGNENKDSDGDDDGHKTPQPEYLLPLSVDLANSRKQQSRDSGFIGSCDDLLKEQKTNNDVGNNDSSVKTNEKKKELEKITEEKNKNEENKDKIQHSTPPATSLTRKDSFNNWSSDEETNLMMSKMRQFFKTMIANSSNTHLNTNSKPTTPILSQKEPCRPIPSVRTKNMSKAPQLVYFESELTRLMKTVPGIRDDQVREIVEYLSSEDTWSDSYDSSDYTSSDLEGATVAKSALQQQISASCQQIINKFDNNIEDEEGDEGDGGIMDDSQGLNRETAFVYQKLVASFNKMAHGDGMGSEHNQNGPHCSPPLIAKVMHHIGSRLVALMHEVSSGESHCSTSPKVRYHHRRLQQKLSSASTTTTEDDDSTSDSNLADHLTALEDGMTQYNLLPRSKSHDLLLGEARAHHQSSSGVSDIAEEKEASDYERFSWRGSFESALMATDSRTKLSLLGQEGSASVSALAMAAKRRSAGDLLFSPKSLSREQLDRVRSCGSIGGGNSEDKHWVVTPVVRPTRRRSSVPDATCGSGGSADGEEDDEDDDIGGRSTLPRSLQTGTATTNSLPRLPTTSNAANMHKAHSMHHFLQHNVKSARYRPPGFNRAPATTAPKRAVSAPGLQPSHPRREVRRRSQQPVASSDDVSIADSNSSPIVGLRSGSSKSGSPSPIHGNTLSRGSGSISSSDWQNNEDDIDRLVALHQNRSSLSSLGLRSDSMASVYSGAGEGRYGNVAVRGQVEFGLQYNYKAGALEIHIKQCRDLAAVDVKRNRSDPYVKVYLLPDKSKSGKRKTKVKKHTLNPVFDEILKFHSTLSSLETRMLWLTVWHSDMFGRNDFLGEVMMSLENKVFDDPTPIWYNLQERTEPFEELPSYKGDIVVGLKFVPPDMTIQKKGKRSRGALHVLVKEAKNLTAVKVNGTSDPFCKSYLLPDKGRSNKQKTSVLKRTTSPVWNHSFVYDDVTLQELAERSLELTVWDHDRLASNEFLGGVRFSLGTGKHYGKPVDWMDATGKELLLWQSMLERPNFWVEGCVSLRSSLDHRTF